MVHAHTHIFLYIYILCACACVCESERPGQLLPPLPALPECSVPAEASPYLAQMMAMAMSETMQTPPTSEPAIRESCCPNSDLYSSGKRDTRPSVVHVHAKSEPDGLFYFFSFFFFFPSPHMKQHLRGLFCSTRNRARGNSGPHTCSQSRAEFNDFTARFSLSLSLCDSAAPAHTLRPKDRKEKRLPSVSVWKSMSLL